MLSALSSFRHSEADMHVQHSTKPKENTYHKPPWNTEIQWYIHKEILPIWKCIQRNIMPWYNACIQAAHRKGWFTKLFIGIVPNKIERWEVVPQNFLPHVQLLLSTEKRITTRRRWQNCTSATVQDCYTSGLRNRGKYRAAKEGIVVSHYCNQRKEHNAKSHVPLFRNKLPWQDNRHSVQEKEKM